MSSVPCRTHFFLSESFVKRQPTFDVPYSRFIASMDTTRCLPYLQASTPFTSFLQTIALRSLLSFNPRSSVASVKAKRPSKGGAYRFAVCIEFISGQVRFVIPDDPHSSDIDFHVIKKMWRRHKRLAFLRFPIAIISRYRDTFNRDFITKKKNRCFEAPLFVALPFRSRSFLIMLFLPFYFAAFLSRYSSKISAASPTSSTQGRFL